MSFRECVLAEAQFPGIHLLDIPREQETEVSSEGVRLS
jgi:hypothetical protein